jgi:predicted TIM-barrel fold metal-dependent hydrolase
MMTGAVDCHVHVVDAARFPYGNAGGYRPGACEQGPREELADTLASHGFGHCILVQLSGYGVDNAAMFDAAAYSGGRWRIVAGVDDNTSVEDLTRLAGQGVVGARFNVVNLGRGALARSELLLDAFADLGLVADVQCPARELPDFLSIIEAARGPVVLDHLGLPDVEAGITEAGFPAVLELGKRGSYVKLSGAFRASRRPFPHADLDPYVEALRGAFAPDRRLFGSDWPFVALSARPSYDDTLAMLKRWLPDTAEQRLCLVDVPRRLFGVSP